MALGRPEVKGNGASPNAPLPTEGGPTLKHRAAISAPAVEAASGFVRAQESRKAGFTLGGSPPSQWRANGRVAAG